MSHLPRTMRKMIPHLLPHPWSRSTTGIWACVLLFNFSSIVCEKPTVEVVDYYSPVEIPDSNCSSLGDGMYPDYTQACRMFFSCFEGQKTVFWCTRGFVFNPKSKRCEPPDHFFCMNRSNSLLISSECDQQEDGVYPDYKSGCSGFYFCRGGMKHFFPCPPSTSFDWKTKSCRPSQEVRCESLTCASKDDGLYTDESNGCKRYYQCQKGNIIERICPEGTVFNPRTLRCSRTPHARCPTTNDVHCLGMPDGYYPDYRSGCKAFGLCMDGSLKTFNCPSQTTFNLQTFTCEKDAECTAPPTDECHNLTNGIHPRYEAGCRHFVFCLDGMTFRSGSCPQGKVINPVTGTCQPSTLVFCSHVRDPDCYGFEDGLYPDYGTGCFAFYACLGQKRIATSYCSDGYLFDVSTSSCLPSSFVMCTSPGELSFTARVLDSYRCEGRNGIFPDFTNDCQGYVVCAFGHQRSFSCPEGQWYDYKSKSCGDEKTDLCAAPSVVATFQCLLSDEGFYVSKNIGQWHECWKGIGFTMQCPSGQHYDIHIDECSIGQNINENRYLKKNLLFSGGVQEIQSSTFTCSGKNSGLHAGDNCGEFHICAQDQQLSFVCPSYTMYDKTKNSCRKYSEPNENCSNDFSERSEIHFTCNGKMDGMYSDYNAECRRYFVCESGHKITVYCPEKQKFSCVKMVCDDESIVECRNEFTSVKLNETTNVPQTSINVKPPINDYPHPHHVSPTKLSSGNKATHFYTPDITVERNRIGILVNKTLVPNIISNSFTNKRQQAVKYFTSLANLMGLSVSQLAPTLATTSSLSGDVNHNTKNNRSITIEVTINETSDGRYVCPRGDTGFFADYESGCKKFHICFRTIRKTYTCPSVLLFNPETKNCDLPDNVVCERPEPIEETILDCRGRLNKFFPDVSTECRQYIGCINETPFRFSCPKGKIFSSELQACEFESSVSCVSHESTDSAQRKSDGDTTWRHSHSIPGKFMFDCTNKPDGFYPDYVRHCHVFYRCVRGKKFSHYCKQGLLFNPESGICDFEENVVCASVNNTQVLSTPTH